MAIIFFNETTLEGVQELQIMALEASQMKFDHRQIKMIEPYHQKLIDNYP